MNHLVYYVAIGERIRDLCKLSVDSLYLTGYQGQTHIVTDDPWPLQYAPSEKVTFFPVESTHVWGAKRYKAQHVLNLTDTASFDAIFFNDADTLVCGDVTPMLDQIAANPTKFFVTRTGNRRLMATKARFLFSPTEQVDHATQEMLDSSGVGFVPTPQNLALIAAWDQSNDFQEDTESTRSDAFSLNHAIITTGRLNDAVFLEECERMNGLPGPKTIIRHYPHGQTHLMPKVFANEILRPYLEAHPPSNLL